MKTKTIIIILVIIIILLVLGFVIFFLWQISRQPVELINTNQVPGSESEQEPEQPLAAEVNYRPDPENSLIYFLGLAKKYRQSDYCSKIEDSFEQEVCYIKLDDFLSGDPRQVIDCKNVTNQQDQVDCFENLAIKNNNIDLCVNLSTGEQRTLCQRTFVYEQIKYGNENLCDYLVESERTDCRDIAYLNQVINSGNTDICNNIRDELKKAACFEQAF